MTLCLKKIETIDPSKLLDTIIILPLLLLHLIFLSIINIVARASNNHHGNCNESKTTIKLIKDAKVNVSDDIEIGFTHHDYNGNKNFYQFGFEFGANGNRKIVYRIWD